MCVCVFRISVIFLHTRSTKSFVITDKIRIHPFTQEWVEAHGRVLTPLVLHDALVDSMALLHRLQRDLVNSQVLRTSDFCVCVGV